MPSAQPSLHSGLSGPLERPTTVDDLGGLGARRTPRGGELRVWSEHATSMQLCIWDADDPTWLVKRVPLTRDVHGVWSGVSRSLQPGVPYTIRANGPRGALHAFNPGRDLIDPYARGVAQTSGGEWRSYLIDGGFDWKGAVKPDVPMDATVIYEAHVKGLTRLNSGMPEELRGTYAGLGHWTTIEYLHELGITTVELLPVHQFTSENHLKRQGKSNYWGYNTLNFFSPHDGYATESARREGPEAVAREFKDMVRRLHEAGIEVLLDVVYNHTAEEGRRGPTTSLRGLDNAGYYRQDARGHYIDTTGCGNTLDTSTPAAQRLVLDSLKYWANEMQVDGFRFDLAASLGRDEKAHFDRNHPLLKAILDDPDLKGVKMIAEPWDVGMGGWQVGNFPGPADSRPGYSEWNDGYRDQMREFWLTDVAAARQHGTAPVGIGPFAGRLTGSEHVFGQERGPLASVNFITAHDGFTMADLTAYNTKHNLANGENNRDGTDNNRSFNHGAEGPTDDRQVLSARAKAMRNMLGTLLLSAGVPMLTAGDEFGRTQHGNNNAYCHDSELTWLDWEWQDWQHDLWMVAQQLIRLRRENPALRPAKFGKWGETVKTATQMDWYNKQGLSMTIEDWNSPAERTLQYLAAYTPENEEFNRILLIVHGLEEDVTVTLPEHADVTGYTLLWDSAAEELDDLELEHGPGSELRVAAASMQLFRAH
jgi:glycogen operon protein